jgi:hypothetical protein
VPPRPGTAGAPDAIPAQRSDAERAGRIQRLLPAYRPWGDRTFRLIVHAFAAAILGLAALILWELVSNARPLIVREGLSFIWGNAWDAGRGIFGGRPFLLGSVVTSAIALVLAVPDVGDPGHLVEFDKTDKIFTSPSSEVTERYVSGRFG